MRTPLVSLLVSLLAGSLAAQHGFPTKVDLNDGVPAPKSSGPMNPAAATVVLPKAYATTMGTTANTFPHARANMRYQQVFLGADIGRPFVMKGLCLRLDERFGGPAQSQTIDLFVGSSTYNHTTLTTNFASNYNGAIARKQVFGGTVNIPQHANGGNVNSWGVCMKFTTPQVWTNAANNNLIVEFINKSASSRSHFEDFCSRGAGCTTTRAYAFSTTATTATSLFRNQGLIMRIDDGILPKNGVYKTFGTGCQGSGKVPCASSNPKGGTFRLQNHNANIFACPIDTKGAVVVLGFELYTKSVTNQTETITTEIYNADAAGKPTGQPVRTGTMKVATATGFYKTTFAPPLAVTANKRIFISWKGAFNRINFPIVNGTNSTHYWHPPNATTWNGPFTSVAWSWKLNCAGGGGAVPVLSNAGVPEIGKQFSLNLSAARPNTAALLTFGTRVNLAIGGGCNLYASLLALVGPINTDGSGSAAFKATVPNDKALVCVKFANQFLVADPSGAFRSILALTNGGEGEIGG